jgi:tetratricopeptide (TPR) repeat protein
LIASVKSPSPETKQLIAKLSFTTEQSAETLVKLIEADPKNAEALGRLCSVYRVNDPQKALEYCHRALEAEPNNIDHAIGYSAALVQARRFDEAVTVLDRLKSVAPDNATIRANLGTALFELKRYAEAKSEYEWLTARPDVPAIAYYFLAICHDRLGEYLDAGANYNLFLRSADPSKNKNEIDNVRFRLPELEKQIKQQNAKSKSKSGD